MHTSIAASTRSRIFDLKYLRTREEVEAFKAWIKTVADPHGVLKRWWEHKIMHRWLLRGIIQCLSNIPLEQWNTMEATTNLGEAQHAWNNGQTGTSMSPIESFKKYEELDIRRAGEIEARVSERARRARTADSTVSGLQTELTEIRTDLAVARDNAKDEPSAEASQHIRELEDAVADLEGKLKLAKAEAKSNSSGRVRGPGASAAMPPQPLELALGVTPAFPTPLSSELRPASPTVTADVATNLPDTRRVSTRKRTQADSSALVPTSTNKRRKKLEDPLVGWVMQDPDTGEELSGHEWVKRYPDEFEKHYKKDHQRYLDYLEQSVGS
ncbi:hypothetical protein B0H13DRAFT_2304025 [Mycena leptocephala]|nr:hypothetical protein B0H13DRAFT_2304025 [Mycena leptocephala]